jgi:hypothetical protein
MSTDNILQVGTTVDLSGLQSGMPAGASLVDTNISKMVSAFERLRNSSKQAQQSLIVDWPGFRSRHRLQK